MRMGMVGDWGWGRGLGSGPGSLRFRHEPGLAQTRFRLGLGCSLSWISLGPHQMWGLFPPRHTTCRWLASLPTGVLVVLSIRGWVLWCVLAHSWWLLAGAWTPGLCRASAWGVICPGVSGLWVHGWICSGVDGCRQGLWTRRCSSLGLLHCGCWVVPLGLSPALLWGGCGSPDNGSPGAFRYLWLGSPPYLSQVQGGRGARGNRQRRRFDTGETGKVVNPKKKEKKKNYKNSGTVTLLSFLLDIEVTFLDYIKGG
ncbi:hypothetical protein ATANTOWER_022212, partial [Ataeniobius toweri]|nr:hypothetical protein [Ataeniobius toweri]